VIIVDNASSDNSVDFIEKNFAYPNIRIISSQANVGFAGGNNLGYENSKGDLIVLLNNDTRVEKDWLSILVEVISTDEKIAAVQSLVITEGIPGKYYEMNGTINVLGHNIMNVFRIGDDGIGEILQANGCSLIIRRNVIEKLGGLFPCEYFAYAEDTYFSLKVKFAGYKILHASRSVVNHAGGGTSKKKKSSFSYFYQERNRMLNFILFFSKSFFIKYIPYLISNFIMKFFLGIFSKKYSVSGLIRAYCWLFTHSAWVKGKREELNKIKTVNENEVLKLISGKMFNGNSFIEKIGNFKSLLYCRLVKINVLEIYKSRK
jgi:GT2 family glycosyltransferase